MSKSGPSLNVEPHAAFIRNKVKTVLSPALTVSDLYSETLEWASIVITDGFRPGDHLSADTRGTDVAASYDDTSGVLTLTGTDTLEHYQQALQTVRYWITAGPAEEDDVAETRAIAWQVSDGTEWSPPLTTSLAITASAEPLFIDLDAAPVAQGASAGGAEDDPAECQLIATRVPAVAARGLHVRIGRRIARRVEECVRDRAASWRRGLQLEHDPFHWNRITL